MHINIEKDRKINTCLFYRRHCFHPRGCLSSGSKPAQLYQDCWRFCVARIGIQLFAFNTGINNYFVEIMRYNNYCLLVCMDNMLARLLYATFFLVNHFLIIQNWTFRLLKTYFMLSQTCSVWFQTFCWICQWQCWMYYFWK